MRRRAERTKRARGRQGCVVCIAKADLQVREIAQRRRADAGIPVVQAESALAVVAGCVQVALQARSAQPTLQPRSVSGRLRTVALNGHGSSSPCELYCVLESPGGPLASIMSPGLSCLGANCCSSARGSRGDADLRADQLDALPVRERRFQRDSYCGHEPEGVVCRWVGGVGPQQSPYIGYPELRITDDR